MKKNFYTGLTFLALTGQVYARSNASFFENYVFSRGQSDVKREELLVFLKDSHFFFTKQGDYVRVRLQHNPLKVGDLELGVAAHPECRGDEGFGFAFKYRQKGSLMEVRYFPSRDWIDIFTTVSKGDFSFDMLASYYTDTGDSWARIGVDRKICRELSVGYEARLNRKLNQWKTQYHGPRVRFTRRF